MNAVDKDSNNAGDLVTKFNNTVTQQVQKYHDVVHNRDETILNDLYQELYTRIIFLHDKINEVINDPDNRTELSNFDFLELAKNYTYSKEINGSFQYGLGPNMELNKRIILDNILSNYDSDMEKLRMNNNLAYTTITTKDCFMYILEPYNRTVITIGEQRLDRAGQEGLSAGFYYNHPWCQEFNRNPTNAPLVTDPYYAKSQHQKVISVYFSLPPGEERQALLGGALNMKDFISSFYDKHKIDETNTKLMLLVKYNYLNAKPTLFDFDTPKNLGSNTINDLPVAEYANSTLTKEEEDRIISDINRFDSSSNNNWQDVSVGENSNMSDYAITATTNTLDQNNKFSLPIRPNDDHNISWEWIMLRKILQYYKLV